MITQIYARTLSIFTGMLLTILTLLMLFEGFAFNIPFYISGFEAYNVADIVNISNDSLKIVTADLVNYIDDGSGDLNVKVEIDGVMTPYFNIKEQAHLTDIRHLVRRARNMLATLKTIFFVALALNVLFLKGIRKYVFLKYSVFATIATLLVLSLMYFMDFSWAFTQFHLILFYNNLWLLDPSKDRLLQMMPLEFFMRFTMFWLFSVAAMQLIYLSAYRILKKFTDNANVQFEAMKNARPIKSNTVVSEKQPKNHSKKKKKKKS